MTRTPADLGASVLNEIDQALADIGSPVRMSLQLGAPSRDGIIAPSTLAAAFATQRDIALRFVSLRTWSWSLDVTEERLIVMSRRGRVFFSVQSDASGMVRLVRHRAVGEVVQTETGTWKALRRQLRLSDTAIVIGTRAEPKEGAGSEGGNFVVEEFLRHRSLAFGILAVSLAVAMLAVVPALGFRAFIDHVLPHSANQSLIALSVLLLGAALASGFFTCLRDYCEHVLFARYQGSLAREVFGRLFAMDMQHFDRTSVGDQTKLVDQLREAAAFLARTLLGSASAAIALIVVLPILVVFSIELTLLVVAIGAAMALTVGAALRPIRRRVRAAYGHDAAFRSAVVEMLKGMRTIKSLAVEAEFVGRANRSLAFDLHGGFGVGRANSIVNALLHVQTRLITIGILLFGAHLVFASRLTIGELIAFNLLAAGAVSPLVTLAMTAHGVEAYRLASKRLNGLPPVPVLSPRQGSGAIRLDGDIQLRNVWFSYAERGIVDDPHWVLRGVDLTIRRGEVVGIVGASGSGKSTLLDLIAGLCRPTRGAIMINGIDLTSLPGSVLRERMAVVPQVPFLFEGTLLDDMLLGRSEASLAEVRRALDRAECSFVTELPQGVLTRLQHEGRNLSLGERQRLAIARALLRDADVLLFDEPTSALDPVTAESVRRTIQAACAGRTALIVSHRPELLAGCDRLLAVRDGQVQPQTTNGEPVERTEIHAAEYA